MNDKKRARLIFSKLEQNYFSVPLLFLDYKTDAQMLCAIILSAQSTDAQVNKVTKELFKKYKSVNDFSNANLKIFEIEIKSTGFYKQKAKRVIECFNIIKNNYGGKIPLRMSDLISLPGVGRKTANLVLANKGIIEGIAVDTHVARLARRMNFTNFREQFKIEKDLLKIFDKKIWGRVNGLFISHGRRICVARNPKCNICFLNKRNLCPKKGLK
jgi:endonuclease III